MFAHLIAHRIDLIERVLHRLGSGDFARHPDRKENRAESALLHARNVDAARRVARAEVEIAVHQALGRVVVSIHHDRVKMQLAWRAPRVHRTSRRAPQQQGRNDRRRQLIRRTFTPHRSPKDSLRLARACWSATTVEPAVPC